MRVCLGVVTLAHGDYGTTNPSMYTYVPIYVYSSLTTGEGGPFLEMKNFELNFLVT